MINRCVVLADASIMQAYSAEILVVDDDPVSRVFLRAVLKKAGYQVCPVVSGEEALVLLDDHPRRFHAVFLDRCMGGMNGLDVLRKIKKDARLASLPVILQTASDRPEDVIEGMQAGAFYYLPKPVSLEMVRSVTRTAVDDHFRYREAQEKLFLCARTLALMESGNFRLKTMEEADDLTHLLAQACPQPDMAVLGISELLINAIEHGNLEISYDMKGELMLEHRLHEEINRRLNDSQWCDRYVMVQVRRTPEHLTITIRDEGPGFDWRKYQQFELSPERLMDTHGRGMLMARASGFDTMDYMGNGNTVVLGVRLPRRTRL